MNYKYYPEKNLIMNVLEERGTLLMLISFNGEDVIISPIDISINHKTLLVNVGRKNDDISQYFHIILNYFGADWAFICPPDYKSIENEQQRISAFYIDGFKMISNVLSDMGLFVGIDVPKRYQRH